MIAFIVKAAPVPEIISDGPYFPKIAGTRWNYADGDFEFKYIIDTVTANDDGSLEVTIGRIDSESSVIASGKLILRRDGIYEKTGFPGGAILDPPSCMFKLPVKPGVEWKSKFTALGMDMESTRTAFGPERVKVPAGSYDAIRVESVSLKQNALPWRETRWYAANIGIVKWMTPKQNWVLKSFEPGSK